MTSELQIGRAAVYYGQNVDQVPNKDDFPPSIRNTIYRLRATRKLAYYVRRLVA